MSRTRVAILGGGPSALTCAFHLTSTAELRNKYEITIYQMGWRLGGKTASGRNRKDHDRIEEHGLHILFGFYQNAFKMLRQTYEELNRPAGSPLATLNEALTPRSFAAVEHLWNGVWSPLALSFGRNNAVTGDGPSLNASGAYISRFLQDLFGLVLGYEVIESYQRFAFPQDAWLKTPSHTPESKPDALVRMATVMLRWTSEILHDASKCMEQRCERVVTALASLRNLAWTFLLAPLSRRSGTGELIATAIDFATSLMIGMIRDGVLLEKGYDNIDHLDFREWLTRHGARKKTLDSPYVRFIYDSAFCYQDGNCDEPRCGAGTSCRTILRILLTYKGALYYKMNGGMGDVVNAPLYEVLKKRGVRFAFFHKATNLRLSPDKLRIAAVEMEQQVDLKSGDPFSYEPLFDCRGLPSWPNEPLYEQIDDAQAKRLNDEHIELESYYTTWKGRPREIKAGVDYDTLVLGTPIGTIPFLCKELLDPNLHTQTADRWRAMVDKVQSVSTISVQIWSKKSANDMGWPMPDPLLSTYINPINTWSNMSQVIPTESFPEGEVRDISYFTGPQRGPTFCPPVTELDFEKKQTAEAYEQALSFVQNDLTVLWPKAVDPNNPRGFDFNLLVADPNAPSGPERFKTQYWRSNCGPSDRCTLPLPNTNQYRLQAGKTGYRNLVVTGDWIDNNFYIACYEGAVMGGILAARAVSGVNFRIVGEELDKW